jgi:hypothetical protein
VSGKYADMEGAVFADCDSQEDGGWRHSSSVYDDGGSARRSAGGRPVGDEENCHGPPPDHGFTVLADCLTKVLAAEMHRRVPDSGPQAFRV